MTTESTETPATLSSRRELLFLYDCRMINPNGDPDENRPRVLPDGTFYVTDVRLKRFARDYLAQRGHGILVGPVEGRTTNLTGRDVDHLEKSGKAEATGRELVEVLLDAFVDMRWFGSSLAFKAGAAGKRKAKWEPDPKTLTGAVQLNMGEVLHKAEELRVQGTSVFGSDEDKRQGTFTEFNALRYAMIGFHGVANEHSAKLSRMTDADYDLLLESLWKGVRSAANTRSKTGQVPRLLVSVEYRPGIEYQMGRPLEKLRLVPAEDKPEEHWSSPADLRVDLDALVRLVQQHSDKIERVRYEVSPDLAFLDKGIQDGWEPLKLDA